MAKRKRKPGSRKGFKPRLTKDYRDDKYVMYIANVETGILQAATIDPDLTDGEVSQALEDLISQLQEPSALAKLLPETPAPSEPTKFSDEGDTNKFVQSFILMNLRTAFERYGSLKAEDVIGILDVIKTSVKRWSVGMHRRGYLTYIKEFLGRAGVEVRKLSQKEAEELGLTKAFDQSTEGE